MTGTAGGLQAARCGAWVLAALLGLTACDVGPDTTTQLLARQQAIDPPQLWLVQALGDTGAVKGSVYVCADTNLRETFVRTRAEVNGRLCKDTTDPVIKENGWALRCTAFGRPFGVSAVTVGDPQQDFRQDFMLTALNVFTPTPEHAQLSARQTRHFRRVGPCPMGWRIGDQAKPGKRPRV